MHFLTEMYSGFSVPCLLLGLSCDINISLIVVRDVRFRLMDVLGSHLNGPESIHRLGRDLVHRPSYPLYFLKSTTSPRTSPDTLPC